MPATVREWVEERAATAPDNIFLVAPESGREISNRQLRDSLASLSGAFNDWGVAPGGIVAAMVGNGWAMAQLLLGSMVHARIFLPLNLAAGDGQFVYVLRHSRARLLVADERNRARAEAVVALAAAEGVRVALVTVACDEDIAGGAAAAATDGEDIPAAADPALLIYTSGTSGLPKGVLHSHTGVLAGGHNVALAHGLRADDRALCVLPLCHINGLCVTVMGPLVSGGGLALPHRFSVENYWRWAEDHACTWLSLVPTQISYLLSVPPLAPPPRPASVRFARSASAPLPPDVLRQFEARFQMPMLETMGLTETAAQILANPPPPAARKPGSPGLPQGCEVTLLDADGREVAAGDEGEIAVRGRNVMLGYLNNPDADKETFTADGWMRTGDLGRRDADGYFFVVGRRKELIIKGGENIAPREIDEALLLGGGVLEAAAFARPCKTYGQNVAAAVVLEDNAALSEDELIARCRRQVGDFRAPVKIYFMDDLPKGPSGKIQRRHLAEMVE